MQLGAKRLVKLQLSKLYSLVEYSLESKKAHSFVFIVP